MAFKLEMTPKPQPGQPTAVEIPEDLAKALGELVPKVMKSADHELTLTADTEAEAKKMALYARAWGARQTPKLYIHKVPNGKRYEANVARLAVDLDADVPAENRPGRPSAAK